MDIYAAALPGCPGLGAKNIRELIDHFNTPEDVWNASEKDIIDLHVLTPAREKAFLKYRRETDLEKLEKKRASNRKYMARKREEARKAWAEIEAEKAKAVGQ